MIRLSASTSLILCLVQTCPADESQLHNFASHRLKQIQVLAEEIATIDATRSVLLDRIIATRAPSKATLQAVTERRDVVLNSNGTIKLSALADCLAAFRKDSEAEFEWYGVTMKSGVVLSAAVTKVAVASPAEETTLELHPMGVFGYEGVLKRTIPLKDISIVSYKTTCFTICSEGVYVRPTTQLGEDWATADFEQDVGSQFKAFLTGKGETLFLQQRGHVIVGNIGEVLGMKMALHQNLIGEVLGRRVKFRKSKFVARLVNSADATAENVPLDEFVTTPVQVGQMVNINSLKQIKNKLLRWHCDPEYDAVGELAESGSHVLLKLTYTPLKKNLPAGGSTTLFPKNPGILSSVLKATAENLAWEYATVVVETAASVTFPDIERQEMKDRVRRIMTAIKEESPLPLFEEDADPPQFSEFVKQIAEEAFERMLERGVANTTVVFDEAKCE